MSASDPSGRAGESEAVGQTQNAAHPTAHSLALSLLMCTRKETSAEQMLETSRLGLRESVGAGLCSQRSSLPVTKCVCNWSQTGRARRRWTRATPPEVGACQTRRGRR